jgi:hypothetical protein
VQVGDSSGISETDETLQERSDEAARRSPAGKRPTGTEINESITNKHLNIDPFQVFTKGIVELHCPLGTEINGPYKKRAPE